MYHIIRIPDYGKTAIIKGTAILYYFFIIYPLKINKTPNKLHTFIAFQIFLRV